MKKTTILLILLSFHLMAADEKASKVNDTSDWYKYDPQKLIIKTTVSGRSKGVKSKPFYTSQLQDEDGNTLLRIPSNNYEPIWRKILSARENKLSFKSSLETAELKFSTELTQFFPFNENLRTCDITFTKSSPYFNHRQSRFPWARKSRVTTKIYANLSTLLKQGHSILKIDSFFIPLIARRFLTAHLNKLPLEFRNNVFRVISLKCSQDVGNYKLNELFQSNLLRIEMKMIKLKPGSGTQFTFNNRKTKSMMVHQLMYRAEDLNAEFPILYFPAEFYHMISRLLVSAKHINSSLAFTDFNVSLIQSKQDLEGIKIVKEASKEEVVEGEAVTKPSAEASAEVFHNKDETGKRLEQGE